MLRFSHGFIATFCYCTFTRSSWSAALPTYGSSLQQRSNASDLSALDINFHGNHLAETTSNSLVVDVSSNHTTVNNTTLPISVHSLGQSAVSDMLFSLGSSTSNQTDTTNLSSPGSVNLTTWPQVLIVPHFPHMFIRVTRVKFLDSFQAVDMKLALINLKGTVCSNHFGQRIHVAKSQIAHTLTEACVSCEADFGISLQFQKATLIAALQVIWEGQTAYGPAEIQADVMTNEAVAPGQPPRRLGKLWGSTIQIPATPEHYWDRSSFSLKLDGLPGHRISLQTDPILSPTLDIWNTKWFRDLLERTVHQIRDVGRPQTRINSYEVELPPQYMQHIRFSFFSSKVPGTELPTYEVLSSLMITLNNLFKYQGARELKFTLVNDKDGPIAYGHMEFRRPRVNGLGLALINASDTSAAKTSN